MQDEVSRQVAVAMQEMREQYGKKVKVERKQHEEKVKEEQKQHEESTREERQRGKWEQERLRDEIKRLESRLDSVLLATSQNQVNKYPQLALYLDQVAHTDCTFQVRPQAGTPSAPRSELVIFLESFDLEYLDGILSENEVDMDVLPLMSEEDFRQLEISHGASRSLWEAARAAGAGD
jgi:hypothetical protein